MLKILRISKLTLYIIIKIVLHTGYIFHLFSNLKGKRVVMKEVLSFFIIIIIIIIGRPVKNGPEAISFWTRQNFSFTLICSKPSL